MKNLNIEEQQRNAGNGDNAGSASAPLSSDVSESVSYPPLPPRDESINPMAQPRLAPHIQRALDQMLAMGFRNDNDWLTQLLMAHDGDIPTVLDIFAGRSLMSSK